MNLPPPPEPAIRPGGSGPARRAPFSRPSRRSSTHPWSGRAYRPPVPLLPRCRDAGNRRRTLPSMPEHQEHASGVARAAVEAVENSVSVREARAHLAEHINRAESGTPTVVTRNGAPVAALVPFADFEVLEEAADLMLAREAEAVLARDEPTVTMAELVADLFSGRTPGPA
ncbi:predicted protein [Streptomyces albidoflavus]|nr:predicted protein [Streptomyces albidoflavus]